jgi:PAS domain-containing protein
MEGRYRGLLVEAAPDAMGVVNQGGDIVLLNLQAEKQFGYRRDELLGQPVKNTSRRALPNGWSRTICGPRKTRWRSRSARGLSSPGGARMAASFRSS